MDTAIVVAFITGGISLIGTIITVLATGQKQSKEFAVKQGKLETIIENLTKEVQKHNGFAERLPVVETKVENLTQELKEVKEKIA